MEWSGLAELYYQGLSNKVNILIFFFFYFFFVYIIFIEKNIYIFQIFEAVVFKKNIRWLLPNG